MSEKIELLTIKDVMELLHIGKYTATRILHKKGCPMLPRKKGEKYLVLKDEFIEWVKFAGYKGKW
ncbi:MAG: helix-turn-helix domain-containing protein [Lachnospiraceae bacterium]|nr:helix-turn-helix domain-containing protein [Lachnospiraceae bacterium]